ncbi:MAG: L,D-transpeptidase family protein [Steroidobacteraceae bacterium]
MTSKLRATFACVVLAASFATLVGCSLLDPAREKDKLVVAPPAPIEPQLAAPIDTHRFEIDPETDDVVGAVQVTIASKEDTLPDIARRFNIGYEEIVRANPGVDPWLPGAGKEIVVPTQFILPNAPRQGVVINVAAMRIWYFPAPVKVKGKTVKRLPGEKQVVFTHPIGVGKVGWRTPEGVTKIVSRQKDPTWRPSAAVRKEHAENNDPIPAVIGPGPDNPLGKYKFTLGWPSYLIHGTNKPYGVGLRSSHGCIRLYPEDIEKFFAAIPIGTSVRVVNQPFLFGWHNDQLYLQAYTVLEDDPRDWKKSQQKLLSKSFAQRIQKELEARGEKIDWERVAALAHDPRGVPVSISSSDATLEAILAAAPRVANRVPEGSNWDGGGVQAAAGEDDLKQMVEERDPDAAASAASAGPVEPPPEKTTKNTPRT